MGTTPDRLDILKIAGDVGCDPRTVRRAYERGRGSPNILAKIARAAQAMGVAPPGSPSKSDSVSLEARP